MSKTDRENAFMNESMPTMEELNSDGNSRQWHEQERNRRQEMAQMCSDCGDHDGAKGHLAMVQRHQAFINHMPATQLGTSFATTLASRVRMGKGEE